MTTESLAPERPGSWIDTGMGLDDIEPGRFNMKIPTDRYHSEDIVRRERDQVWMRVWQMVGRADDLPKTGDWIKHTIFDQSYIVVRGKDGLIRGFVNACRHRGNVLCTENSGNVKRNFLCQYHLWSYDLEGKLKGILRQDKAGPIETEQYGLIEVPVDTFGGFVFLNPDVNAAPLSDFLGDELQRLLTPYHLDQMTTVLNVRESLDCNWKVVMDAFSEGYHINGIHPQLLRVIDIDPETTRYIFWDRHSVSVAPFDVKGAGAENQVAGVMELPETFPSTAAYLPRFQELVAEYRDADGTLTFPEGVSARTLLQQATRDTLTHYDLDVSELTDAQMSDNQGWGLFPNFFMTVRAGEATVIQAFPDAGGDPNKCAWHITSVMYIPEEHKAALHADLVDVDTPGSFKYFEALQQDYVQMPRQQIGLRNKTLDHMTLVREEAVVAHFHSVLDNHMSGRL